MSDFIFIMNWASAIAILFLVIYIFKITYEMKYKFHHVVICIIQGKTNATAVRWMMDNKYYVWCIPLIITGIMISLDYANKLNGGSATFMRSEVVQIIAPLFYISMAGLLHGKHQRVKKLNEMYGTF